MYSEDYRVDVENKINTGQVQEGEEQEEEEIEEEQEPEPLITEKDSYMQRELERIELNKLGAKQRVERVKNEAEQIQIKAEKDAMEFEMANVLPKSTSQVKEAKVSRGIVNVPRNNSKKTYMDYKKITNKSSLQWKIQNSGKTWIDENGFQRFGDEGMYVIALGKGFGEEAGNMFRNYPRERQYLSSYNWRLKGRRTYR